jgi:hypothetical protein
MFAPALTAVSLGDFAEDPSSLSAQALEEGFERLQRLSEAVEATRLRWLAELERRGPWRRDGFVSGSAWLADRFGLSSAGAREQMKVAVALEEMPLARRALDAGEVSSSAVRILAVAMEDHPEAFRAQEAALVDQAQTRGVDELRRVMGEWSQAVDAEDGAAAMQRMRDRRSLSVCPTATGMIRVKGELDPESGEVVTTALQALVDVDVRASGRLDMRTSGQRWADALTELARAHLDSPDRPTVAGERPHLTVTVDGQSLARGVGLAQLDHAGGLDPAATRRLACDASVLRVVLASPSEPIDIGRRTPVVSAALRRAVVVRDRGCTFPGCHRPHAWCDAHHVRHWAEGGGTGPDNLVLMCRPHHRLVHEGGFGVVMREGKPVFRRPDGSVLEDGRGPP